jgi:hypothetical protein
MITTADTNLLSCNVLELIQHANREQVAYHLADDRLIVHPHDTRRDIVDALLARAEEVRAFLALHRRHVWHTPPEEEAYRKARADEQCLAMFGMEWQALVNLTIDSLADRVGEAWERYAARITPLVPDATQWDGCEGGIQ